MIKTFSVATVILFPAVISAWELTPSASYGACFLDGAPNAYMATTPPAKTNEPLAAGVTASFGLYGVNFSYAQRYELYSQLGEVHDFTLVGRAAVLVGGPWAFSGEAGVAFSRAPAPKAFLFFQEGFTNDWTPVVGVLLEVRASHKLTVNTGVSYRERLQVINFFEVEPCYGAVKSPAIDFTAGALFAPWPVIAVGPSFRQILYGPYDYYLYSQTNRNDGWVTGKETYIMATIAFPLEF